MRPIGLRRLAADFLVPTRWAPEAMPTKFPPVSIPILVGKSFDLRCREGFIEAAQFRFRIVEFVQRFRDRFVAMGHQIVVERLPIEFATGDSQALGELIRRVEKGVRDRNCRLHAKKYNKSYTNVAIGVLNGTCPVTFSADLGN